MRFMMMVKGNDDYEAGAPPSPELSVAIGKHAEEMARAGILLDMGGLLPSAHGAKVRVSGGKTKVLDGPFAEAKELVGGYAILRADSKAEAVRLGREFMQLHADVLGPAYEGELEIRQLADLPD
jgi:hypothetical protein